MSRKTTKQQKLSLFEGELAEMLSVNYSEALTYWIGVLYCRFLPKQRFQKMLLEHSSDILKEAIKVKHWDKNQIASIAIDKKALDELDKFQANYTEKLFKQIVDEDLESPKKNFWFAAFDRCFEINCESRQFIFKKNGDFDIRTGDTGVEKTKQAYVKVIQSLRNQKEGQVLEDIFGNVYCSIMLQEFLDEVRESTEMVDADDNADEAYPKEQSRGSKRSSEEAVKTPKRAKMMAERQRQASISEKPTQILTVLKPEHFVGTREAAAYLTALSESDVMWCHISAASGILVQAKKNSTNPPSGSCYLKKAGGTPWYVDSKNQKGFLRINFEDNPNEVYYVPVLGNRFVAVSKEVDLPTLATFVLKGRFQKLYSEYKEALEKNRKVESKTNAVESMTVSDTAELIRTMRSTLQHLSKETKSLHELCEGKIKVFEQELEKLGEAHEDDEDLTTVEAGETETVQLVHPVDKDEDEDKSKMEDVEVDDL